MALTKTDRKRIVASALSLCFLMQQSLCFQAVASEIGGDVPGMNTGITVRPGETGNIYDIKPSGGSGDIGFREYDHFNLTAGDIANLIMNFKGQDLSKFVNLVNDQININGIVNALNSAGGLSDGKVVFISPNGMVVGASGVLNVGSLSVITPSQNDYDKFLGSYKPSDLHDLSNLENSKGTGTVTIDGKVLSRGDIDIKAAGIDVRNGAVLLAGVKNNDVLTSITTANDLFSQLVNTGNVNAGSTIANENGNIVIKAHGSNGGVNIAGNVSNFAKNGNTTITNEAGSKGIDISGKLANAGGTMDVINNGGAMNVSGIVTNAGAKLTMENNGTGMNITSGAKVQNDNVTELINTGRNGMTVEGKVSGNGVNLRGVNSDIVIGHSSVDENITSKGALNINLENGDLLNAGVDKTLLVSNGDMNITVKDGTIGLDVGNCADGACTGVDPDARDLTKSINIKAGGAVNASTTRVGSSNSNLVANIAAKDSDLRVGQIKADGKVILTAADFDNNGNGYSILNASNDSSKANVEGKGISLIASKNIGEKGNKLTFNQTDTKYGMDALAIKDINIKGQDDKNNTRVCTMISREGSIDAEFSGNTTIDEITAKDNIKIVNRGASLSIENLGSVPNTPVDYFGKNIT